MIRKIDNELFVYLDSIRKDQNISQEDLCFPIITESLYRKYLKGSVKAPLEVIEALSNRLGFRFDFFMREFSNQTYQENELVTQFFNLTIGRNFKEAMAVYQVIIKKPIIQKENQLFFETSVLIKRLFEKDINSFYFSKAMKSLIDFEHILKKSTVSLAEAYGLGLLLDNVVKEEKEAIAKKLESLILTPNKVIFGNHSHVINLVALHVVKYLEKEKLYERELLVLTHAIEASKKNKNSYLLEYFHYFLGYCYQALGNEALFYDHMFYCYCLYIASEDKQIIETFDYLFKKDFKTSPGLFIRDYLDKKEVSK
ncbi:MAG: helix-turn-helix transcriptional regulator [Paracholeplasma sp.]|nr:helix-turn-helix transcriptional regulator [Paracholeplasma sp.]MDY3195664.1 helix-turn-helix transcriptional regulator [Paracholeplasma sp.]